MADLDIAIAGRNYRVACADGEEENLTEAARLVAAEAESLREQFGTRFAALPETRMLLMASLMLGDRFRAHLAEEAAAFADPESSPAAEGSAPSQSGFFDDPRQTARIAELEAALAASRETEQAALAALEEAAERIRALAGEIAEGDAMEDEGETEDDEDTGEDTGEVGGEDEDLDALDPDPDAPEAAFEEPADAEAPEPAFDETPAPARTTGDEDEDALADEPAGDDDPLHPRS